MHTNSRMTKTNCVNGLLVIDKPLRMTSRDAVNRAWGWFPRGTRIGHAGTLDPLATGVLVICVGAATRLVEYVQRMEKVYQADIRLGARSSTDDAEGTLTENGQAVAPNPSAVAELLTQFVGTIEQVPPDFSAAKVDGRRAYALARRGKAISLEARPVTIHAITVLAYAYPRLRIEVQCGKGTYIRSLARDIGDRLGCGAYLENLRRTRIGPFLAESAVPLDTERRAAFEKLMSLSSAV